MKNKRRSFRANRGIDWRNKENIQRKTQQGAPFGELQSKRVKEEFQGNQGEFD